jgi:hypothetical protein
VTDPDDCDFIVCYGGAKPGDRNFATVRRERRKRTRPRAKKLPKADLETYARSPLSVLACNDTCNDTKDEQSENTAPQNPEKPRR